MKKRLIVALLLSLPCAQARMSIEKGQRLTGLPKHLVEYYLNGIENMKSGNEAPTHWGAYYHIFSHLIEEMGLKIGAEIGVSTGGHSEYMLTHTTLTKLYSIDPWAPDHETKLDPDLYKVFYATVIDRLEPFSDRSEIIRDWGESPAVLNRFATNSLDFVFIDGSHLYHDVLKDITLWYEKVRSGGLIGGDDYETKWPGVKQAVDEFFSARGLTIYQDEAQPRIWWIIKP